MKVTILGCGGSGGVPLAGGTPGGFWGSCDPDNPKNRRTRTSALLEVDGKRILIDTSPDLRDQLLSQAVPTVDAVLYTHAHADHCHGIDDLRAISFIRKEPIPAFMSAITRAELLTRFDYALASGHQTGGYLYPPILDDRVIEGPFTFEGLKIIPFKQNHGNSETLGFRVGPVAYSTDVVSLEEEAFALLAGVKLWVLDCLRLEAHPTHSHLAQSLAWIKRVGAARGVLIHMNHSLDYEALRALCPAGVEPAYDGLVVEVS